MASFPPPTPTPTPTSFTSTRTTTTTATKTLSCSPSFSKSSTQLLSHTKQSRRFKVSCNVAAGDNNKKPQKLTLPETPVVDLQNVDRRNLLLGLGGLYSTVSLPSALALPITTPDISKSCKDAFEGFQDAKNTIRGKACCPTPSPNGIKDFVFPKDKTTRVRPAAHRASADYITKYKAAIKAMRDLPDDHPHSFVQQARIHCAYCNGSYTQVASGFPDLELQIHNSWLFFPFHRWYLYFYERILGKLINDPTFALPYWNWDSPGGMLMPAMFEDDGKKNPLFDAFRDASHVPPAVVDLDYNGADSGADCIKQISVNLAAMYNQMVSNAGDTTSFFGGSYVAGPSTGDPSVGTIEAGCHTAIHRWVGDPRMPNNEDMGNFYSAGYDPLFYVHHTNVDRMWVIWKALGIQGHIDPTEPDWLNASYVFYDENEQLVRVYNKDCVDNTKLNYEYEKSPIPWLNNRSTPRNKKADVASKSVGKVKDVKFPITLDKIAKVLVKRPAKSRSKEDKKKANELLLIKGIKFDSEKFVKFDVFVNDQDDVPASSAAESEFAGSFAQLPHNQRGKMFMRSAARFGLTELLEDIEAEDDDSILVTLVPRSGCDDLTISEIKIDLIPVV